MYVGSVADRSSAREAGLQEGDVITAIDGKPTDNSASLQEQMAKHRPGDTVKVNYVRDNKNYEVNVKLLNPQGSTAVTKATSFTDLGCAFKKADEKLLKQLGLSAGVQVVDLGKGIASEAGMRNGFVITSINDIKVSRPEDVEKIYHSVVGRGDQERVMIVRGVYPTGKRGIYALDLAGE